MHKLQTVRVYVYNLGKQDDIIIIHILSFHITLPHCLVFYCPHLATIH